MKYRFCKTRLSYYTELIDFNTGELLAQEFDVIILGKWVKKILYAVPILKLYNRCGWIAQEVIKEKEVIKSNHIRHCTRYYIV